MQEREAWGMGGLLVASVERELVTGARLLIAHSVPASHVGASQVVASSVDRILSAFLPAASRADVRVRAPYTGQSRFR